MKKIALWFILFCSITCHAVDPEPKPQNFVQKTVEQIKQTADSALLGLWICSCLFCCGVFPFPR